jgi:hypothetical protein
MNPILTQGNAMFEQFLAQFGFPLIAIVLFYIGVQLKQEDSSNGF